MKIFGKKYKIREDSPLYYMRGALIIALTIALAYVAYCELWILVD